MKKDKISYLMAIAAVLILGLVAYFVMSVSKTVPAIVLIEDVEAGTIVTEDMITEIKIPEKTPEGYLRNKQSIVGYKLKTSVSANQLLYESDFMSSWTNYADSEKIPDDYVITSIQLEDKYACGGVITAGDYVDIMAQFEYNNEDSGDWQGVEATAVEVNGTGRTDTGTTVAYILSNVYILNTNSALAESQESDMSTAQGGEQQATSSSDEGSYYVFALSYDDAKKLRQVEGVEGVKLYMNICPAQNQAEGGKPLLKQMVGQSYSFLHDAQEAVQDKEGNMLVEDYYVVKDDGTIERKSSEDKENENSTEEGSENTEGSTEEGSTEESSSEEESSQR